MKTIFIALTIVSFRDISIIFWDYKVHKLLTLMTIIITFQHFWIILLLYSLFPDPNQIKNKRVFQRCIFYPLKPS
jgi:hypothetical protein